MNIHGFFLDANIIIDLTKLTTEQKERLQNLDMQIYTSEYFTLREVSSRGI